MKLPVLFSEPSSPYTWITPPEDVGDTLLAEGEGVQSETKTNQQCFHSQSICSGMTQAEYMYIYFQEKHPQNPHLSTDELKMKKKV